MHRASRDRPGHRPHPSPPPLASTHTRTHALLHRRPARERTQRNQRRNQKKKRKGYGVPARGRMHGSSSRRAERQHPRAIKGPPPRESNSGPHSPHPLPTSIKSKSPQLFTEGWPTDARTRAAAAAKWWRLEQLCPPCAKAAAAPPPLRRAGLPPRTWCAKRTSAIRAKHFCFSPYFDGFRCCCGSPPDSERPSAPSATQPPHPRARTRSQGAGGDSRHSPWHDSHRHHYHPGEKKNPPSCAATTGALWTRKPPLFQGSRTKRLGSIKGGEGAGG